MESLASGKEIEIKTKVPIDSMAYFDNNFIETILRNLLTNSIKYTNNGGRIEVGITNGELAEHSMLTVYIQDSGIGMPHETIEKLFKIDQYITTPGTNQEKGTGLGLILCKEFVDKHGGKIWAESELGNGSTFYFTLPKYKV